MKFRIVCGEKLTRPLTEFAIKTGIFSAIKHLHGHVGSAVSIELVAYKQVTDRLTEIEIKFLSVYKVKVHSALTLMTQCGDTPCAVLAMD